MFVRHGRQKIWEEFGHFGALYISVNEFNCFISLYIIYTLPFFLLIQVMKI
jgi:hypothetical protein